MTNYQATFAQPRPSPFKNAIYLFGGEILAHLLGFIATLYCAQKVGVINFGWINFSLSLVSYGLILANFGLLTLGVKRLSQHQEENITDNLLSLRLILAVFVFLILAIIATFLRKPPVVKNLLYLYSLFLFINAFSLEWFFQAKERMEYIGITRVLMSLSYLILLLIFVQNTGDYLKVPISYLFGQGIGTGFLLILYTKIKPGSLRLTFHLRQFKNLFFSALPLGTINILQVFYTYFGIILLGFIGTPQELGIYSAMYRLLFFTLIIDRVAHFLLLPLISSSYTTHFSKLPKLFVILSRIILFTTLSIVLIVLIIPSPLISVLFGKDYIEGGNLLRILVLFLPLTTLSTLYATGLIAGNREKLLLINTLIGTVINMLISPLLYIGLKGLGIGLAFIIGEFVITSLNLSACRKEIRFSLRQSLIPFITRQEIEFLRRREL